MLHRVRNKIQNIWVELQTLYISIILTHFVQSMNVQIHTIKAFVRTIYFICITLADSLC